MPFVKPQVGNMIRRIGLKQYQIAKLFGRHPVTVSEWVTDKCMPTQGELILLQLMSEYREVRDTVLAIYAPLISSHIDTHHRRRRLSVEAMLGD